MNTDPYICLPQGVDKCACDESLHLRCILKAIASYEAAQGVPFPFTLLHVLCEEPAAVYSTLTGQPSEAFYDDWSTD